MIWRETLLIFIDIIITFFIITFFSTAIVITDLLLFLLMFHRNMFSDWHKNNENLLVVSPLFACLIYMLREVVPHTQLCYCILYNIYVRYVIMTSSRIVRALYKLGTHLWRPDYFASFHYVWKTSEYPCRSRLAWLAGARRASRKSFRFMSSPMDRVCGLKFHYDVTNALLSLYFLHLQVHQSNNNIFLCSSCRPTSLFCYCMIQLLIIIFLFILFYFSVFWFPPHIRRCKHIDYWLRVRTLC